MTPTCYCIVFQVANLNEQIKALFSVPGFFTFFRREDN